VTQSGPLADGAGSANSGSANSGSANSGSANSGSANSGSANSGSGAASAWSREGSASGQVHTGSPVKPPMRAPLGAPVPSSVPSSVASPPAHRSVPQASSPWWASDARNDPWRDPGSAPHWVAPPPETPAPPAAAPAEPAPAGRQRMAPVLLVALVSSLLAGLLGGALGFAASARFSGSDVTLGPTDDSPAPGANRAPRSAAGIAKRLQPSVVSIDIQAASATGTGSGFIISDQGHILTNNHVVAPVADRPGGGGLRVVFSDGATAPAKIVGRNPGSDIAVIKVERGNLPVITFGDSDAVAVGDPVVAFGSPLGLQGTVTAGIVSALDRPVATGSDTPAPVAEEGAFLAAIQTDAPINPGNSGGPLVDAAGRVIGVNSAIATLPGATGQGGSIGLGFAIPINHAKRIAEQLIATGRARRTIIGAELDQQYTNPLGGVRLAKVVPNEPADKAGLKPGDIVLKFGGKVVAEPVDLIALIRKEPGGEKVDVEYQRGGQRLKAQVTLAESAD
jgi:putative serine protease PepD